MSPKKKIVMTSINEQIDALPPVEVVRAWARQIVAERGDALAHSNYKDGLRIDDGSFLGMRVRLASENVGSPFDGGTHVLARIELATYPDAEFSEIVWDTPSRTWQDVPWQNQGRFRPRQRNEIFLHYPLARPMLVRVAEWRGIPGLGGSQEVCYTLLELDAERERQYAVGHARMAEYQWRDVKRR
jgi:hypothetical protein